MGKKQIKNNQGIVTLPFLLVLVIVLFFSLSFFMLTMTLTHVTVTQYMTYSSARKLFLAGQDKDIQLDLTKAHYEKLRAQFFDPSAYTGQPGDWFYIWPGLEGGDGDGREGLLKGDYSANDEYIENSFYGVNVGFRAQALNLQIPFLIEDDSNQINKTVRIGSFLGREPSQAECRNFHKRKAEKIKNLCSPRDCPDITEPPQSIGDNGC